MGGRFDPIHKAHLQTAQEVFHAFELDEMRLVPTFQPPHREAAVADFAHRCKMIELCIEPLPGFVLDRREQQGKQKSYSWFTLKSLLQDYPDDHWFLMMGSDAFLQFDTWYNWQQILQNCQLIVDLRPGNNWQQLEDKKAKIIQSLPAINEQAISFCEVSQMDLSSSEIRARLGQGFDVSNMLDKKVLDYINQKKLYR